MPSRRSARASTATFASSTFPERISLPMTSAAAVGRCRWASANLAEPTTDSARVSGWVYPSVRRSMPRVLVVEDSASTRAFVRAVLEAPSSPRRRRVRGDGGAAAASTRCASCRAGRTTSSSPTSTCPTSTGSSSSRFVRKTRAPPRDAARHHLDAVRPSATSSAASRSAPTRIVAEAVHARAAARRVSAAAPRGGRERRPERAAGRRLSHGGGGGGRGDGGDKAREEFLSEAQEIVDGLGRDLLALDEGRRGGQLDPELINDVFRAVHTLKGLVGPLRRHADGGALARARRRCSTTCASGASSSRRACSTCSSGRSSSTGASSPPRRATAPDPAAEVEALLVALGQVSQRGRGGRRAASSRSTSSIPGLLGVLTEYEEHRLRTNIQQGLRALPAARAVPARDDRLGARRAQGEGAAARRDHHVPADGRGRATPTPIELEILMASRASVELAARARSPGPTSTIEEVRAARRRERASAQAPPAPPPPPAAILRVAPPASAATLRRAPRRDGQRPHAAELPPPPRTSPSGARALASRRPGPRRASSRCGRSARRCASTSASSIA